MSKLKITFAALASVAFLFLPATSRAGSHGGGGGSHGGGHSGGGHSGGGHYGGSHGGGHYGGGHYGGGHYGGSHYYGGHGGYYGHGGYHYGHGGYYGHGGHYGYWGSGWGWGWGWGFGPWWGWGWGYPYGYYGYGYPYYGYGPGYYGGGGGYGDPRERFASVKTDVDPEEAALYLDGKLIGTADDFDGYPDMLYLGRGLYHLEFRLEGYEPLTTEIDATPGQFFRIDQHMKKIPGAKHYGTYTPERPAGEINRYFEKSRPQSEGPNSDSYRRSPGSPDRPPAMSEDQPVSPNTTGDRQRVYTGGDDDSATADFDDDRPAPAEPAAAGETDSRIVFDVSPPDAAIYVDDRFMGSARELNGLGGGVAVPPGEHRITVTCPGYREATLRLETSAAKGGRAEIELKK